MAIQTRIISDPGIYRRTSTYGESQDDTLLLVKTFAEAEMHSLDTYLEAAEHAHQSVLAPLGAGQRPPHQLPRNASEEARRAVEVSSELLELRWALDEDDAEVAAFCAIRLGRCLERLAILPREPDAKTGAKVRAGGKRGSSKAHGPAAERQARNADWQRFVDHYAAKHGRGKYMDACRMLKEQTGVSFWTIKNNTDNPCTRKAQSKSGTCTKPG